MTANRQAAVGGDGQITVMSGGEVALSAIASQAITVRILHRIEDVEAIWRRFAASSIESPGQSYDFVRLWVRDRGIAEEDQFYVVGEAGGSPVALLPLHRKTLYGLRLFTWFPGSQAGCYAPLADLPHLQALGPEGRAKLWKVMTAALEGAQLLYLRSIPVEVGGRKGLFDELGSSLSAETLYRSEFGSWEECDREQRSRSRRKHDRQQGERLAALGAVEFEEVTDTAEAHAALDIMFAQRSARFRAQGIRDTFVCDDLIGFYRAALDPQSGIDVRLHVLRLDGEIVAVRYNVVHGKRMFCLISSMSDCERIQTGSPGKQCLLRVMQTVFETGFTSFDMGSGFTDEKRHWCNVQMPLRQHYLSLTPVGAAIAFAHQCYQRLRAWAKTSDRVKKWRRLVGQVRDRARGSSGSNQSEAA